jgi:hypothetical protein
METRRREEERLNRELVEQINQQRKELDKEQSKKNKKK